MTIEEARELIPPGWVECAYRSYSARSALGEPRMYVSYHMDQAIYAIPAPKPEPRRVPMQEIVIKFDQFGWRTGVNKNHDYIRNSVGGNNAVANTKWRLDTDAREWVEVSE